MTGSMMVTLMSSMKWNTKITTLTTKGKWFKITNECKISLTMTYSKGSIQKTGVSKETGS